MRRGRISAVFVPCPTGRLIRFSVASPILYAFGFLAVCSWIALALLSCTGAWVYYQFSLAKGKNIALRDKVEELGTLGQLIGQKEQDARHVSEYLGQKTELPGRNTFGRGGIHLAALPSIPSEVLIKARAKTSVDESTVRWTLQRARRLRHDLRELVEAVRRRQQLLATTPSIVPVASEDYCFTSAFGWRSSPFTGRREFHNGLDIGGYEGTPVIAPANGKVAATGYGKYNGKYLRIDHSRACTTTFAHLAGFNVTEGQAVKRGQVIAFMGNTGQSTGPHLHYTITVNNKAVNPQDYILNNRFDQR
jgi:murein DD-endopeptidase MepM/ murein hydrolase activator NlpD